MGTQKVEVSSEMGRLDGKVAIVTGAGGRALSADELDNALSHLYGVLPILHPETSLQDALCGIDPGRAEDGQPVDANAVTLS